MQKKNRFKNFLQGIEFNTNVPEIKKNKRRRSRTPDNKISAGKLKKNKRRRRRSRSPSNSKSNVKRRRSRSRSPKKNKR